jgi:Tol biopolymer transport system component
LSFAVVATTPIVAQQRPQNRIALEQYLDWEEVQNPQPSPDGTKIIFGRRWVDKMNDKWETSIWMMNADGSQAARARAGIGRAVVARRQAHRVYREG